MTVEYQPRVMIHGRSRLDVCSWSGSLLFLDEEFEAIGSHWRTISAWRKMHVLASMRRFDIGTSHVHFAMKFVSCRRDS